jgi:hypothetical protein
MERMVDLGEETSNQVLETLEEWNRFLEQHKRPAGPTP